MSRRSLIAMSTASVAAVGVGGIPAKCAGRVYPGTLVHDLDLGGMTREEGVAAVQALLGEFESHPVTLVLGERRWAPDLADLGMAVDYEATVARAMQRGREGGALGRYTAFFSPGPSEGVELAWKVDQARLAGWFHELAQEIEGAAKDARLVFEEGTVKIVGDEPGIRLDTDHALDATMQAVGSGTHHEVMLETIEVTPAITADDLHEAKEQAWRLISEPVVFTHEGLDYPILPEDLRRALRISDHGEATLHVEELAGRFAAIGAAVAKPARNVRLGWDGGLYVVADDVDGIEADTDAMASLVQRAGDANASRVVPLPVKAVKARARTDNIDSLGLDTHLAAGSSSFAGSSAARAENVRVSARNISYKLIAPGETFSFNHLQGPITEEYGYIAGTIIQGDWVATDIGGGVCQVSTTVFRAAVNAGFRFSEWNPHSWRLGFYELDGSPPGLDAAIYQPNSEWEQEQDLRFTNPLDSWLLLQLVIDGDRVSAHFYGKDPGWTVELFPARISEPKPVGTPVERVNESLPPGERRVVQQAQPGYTVAIRRRITGSDGTVIADGDFVSDYVSQPEAWEIGPS